MRDTANRETMETSGPGRPRERDRLPYYEQDGIRFPRLTRILSILRDPEVEAWQEHLGEKAAMKRQQQAQRRGTLVHKLISQTLLTGKKATLAKSATFEVRMCWQAWLRWYALQEGRLGIQGVEKPCISTLYSYGATPDLWEADMVTDWKTSGSIKAKHWIQVHAEVPLVFGEQAEGIRVRIVRLDPATGDFQEAIHPFSTKVWQTFLKLKDVYMAWYSHEMQPQEERDGHNC